jgi:tetratricopeptide (TPR) repeat protein
MIKSKLAYRLFFIGILIIPMVSFAQFTLKGDAERKKELKEEDQYLDFQTHFFEAIQQKSREDYNKAIEALELCMQIYPNDKGLNFEFAKNYFLLKDYENAIFFDKKALENDTDNIYVLEHLKRVYQMQYDYENAIEIQKRIAVFKPSAQNNLIPLYVRNRQRDKAKILYLDLKKKGLLDSRSHYFKRLLFPQKVIKETVIKPVKSIPSENLVEVLKIEFKKNNNFQSLKKLLTEELKLNQFKNLEEDSKKGLDLFPAQPFVYIMNAKALNKLKKHKKALNALEIGLDFVIDDNKQLSDFYKQMQIAYSGLGKTKEATKYQNKALSLKNIN